MPLIHLYHPLRVFAVVTVAGLLACISAHAQDESRRIRSGQVKVGDRILANPTSVGAKDTCTVVSIRPASWKPGYDGDYDIKCEHNGWTSVPSTGDHVEIIAQNAAPSTAAPASAPRSGGNSFGTRNPRSCSSSDGGAPSYARAAELVACAREGQSRERLEWLVSDVRVTSMVKSVYDPHTQTGFTNMDTAVAPIAIAGSLQSWSCSPQDPPAVMAKYSNAGKNCTHATEAHATGYCYKLRTGSWSCSMTDTTLTIQDRQFNVAPPQ